MSEQRDEICVDWDVPIRMDDGIELRADVFRPAAEGRYAVLMGCGPYAKGLHFEDGRAWTVARTVPKAPGRAGGLEPSLRVLGTYRSRKMGAARLCVRPRGFPRHRSLAGVCRSLVAARDQGPLRLHRVGRNTTLEQRQGRPHGHFLSGDEPMAGGGDAATAPRRDLSLGGCVGPLPRLPTAWRHSEHVHDALVRGAHPNRAIRRRRARRPQPHHRKAGVRRRNHDQGRTDAPIVRISFRRCVITGCSMTTSTGSMLTFRKSRCRYFRQGTGAARECTCAAIARALCAHPRVRNGLELHDLEHWTHFYTDYGRELQKRFFDHFLRGVDNGWDKVPPVILNIRNVDGTTMLRHEDAWPISRTRWTKFYLDPATLTLCREPPASTRSFDYAALESGATFRIVLDEDTEITGPSAAKLFAASSTSDADLFLTLRVLDVEGREVTFQGANDAHTPIAQGWLRASHRKLDAGRTKPYQPYHTHDDAAAVAGRFRFTSWTWRSGRPALLSRRDTLWHSRWKAKTTFTTPLCPRPRIGFQAPASTTIRSTGRTDVFGGTVTLYGGGQYPAHVLLPIVPSA